MPDQKVLHTQRKQIDDIDNQILDLLKQRKDVVQDVLKRKVEKQLPVFVAKREDEKTESFRKKQPKEAWTPIGPKIFYAW